MYDETNDIIFNFCNMFSAKKYLKIWKKLNMITSLFLKGKNVGETDSEF
jgi:hypothetical protein